MLHRRWQRSKEMNQLKPKIGQNSLETVSSPGSLTDRRSPFISSALTKSESSLRSMFARLKVGGHHFRFTALPGWACWGQLFNKPKDVDFSNCQSHSCCFYLRFLIGGLLLAAFYAICATIRMEGWIRKRDIIMILIFHAAEVEKYGVCIYIYLKNLDLTLPICSSLHINSNILK